MEAGHITVLWDREGDILEVVWEEREGHFTPTADGRVLERIDEDGNSLGFMIQSVSSIEGFPAKTFTLGNARTTRNVGTKTAATELGINTSRLRQLLAQGRVEGAERIGRDWVILSPVKVAPAARGPAGVAGRARRSSAT